MSLWQKTDGRHSTLSLIDISSLSETRTHAAERQRCRLKHTDQLLHPQKYFKCKKTISLRAHWYRRTQKRALRPHGELFRPPVKENWATERISMFARTSVTFCIAYRRIPACNYTKVAVSDSAFYMVHSICALKLCATPYRKQTNCRPTTILPH